MIKVDGLKDEIKKLGLIDKIYTQEILRECNKIGYDFRDDVRANTPVDTGDLRRSTHFTGVEKTGDVIEIKVFNNLKYAEPVEYGHRQEVGKYVPAIKKRLKKGFVPGYYMFRNAENRVRKDLDARLMKAVRKAEDRIND